MTLFEQLDFVYMPSRDVAGDIRYFTEVLGAKLIFAVEGMGTRVAMVELVDQPPRLLLAGHLEGDQPVMVYRVADIAKAIDELKSRGWKQGHQLEIPHGPVCTFTTRAAIGSRSISSPVPRRASTSWVAATSDRLSGSSYFGDGQLQGQPARRRAARKLIERASTSSTATGARLSPTAEDENTFLKSTPGTSTPSGTSA